MKSRITSGGVSRTDNGASNSENVASASAQAVSSVLKKNIFEISVDVEDLKCPVSLAIFFDPVMMTPCGDVLERDIALKSNGLLRSIICPCCRGVIIGTASVPKLFKAQLENALTKYPELYQDCYFNLDDLSIMLEENDLRAPKSVKIIRLLQHAANHLNDIINEKGPHEGKSALAILASHEVGRHLLMKDEKLRSMISEDSKKMVIADKAIAEWLMIAEKEKPRWLTFFAVASSDKKSGKLLQHVMDGDYAAAEALLKSINNPASIVVDRVYGKEENERKWQAISPLEFAAWAGDVTDEDEGKGMLNLLLQYVSAELRQTALQQLCDIKEKLTQHGEFLAPYKKLIACYDAFITHCSSWTREQQIHYCIKLIGYAQKRLPRVGMQEFCAPLPFDPMPEFKRAPSRTCKLISGVDLLVGPSSDLSWLCFLYKEKSGGAERCAAAGFLSFMRADRTAIAGLCAAKAEILTRQISVLNSKVNNTPR